jgi:hypothetical protein
MQNRAIRSKFCTARCHAAASSVPEALFCSPVRFVLYLQYETILHLIPNENWSVILKHETIQCVRLSSFQIYFAQCSDVLFPCSACVQRTGVNTQHCTAADSIEKCSSSTSNRISKSAPGSERNQYALLPTLPRPKNRKSSSRAQLSREKPRKPITNRKLFCENLDPEAKTTQSLRCSLSLRSSPQESLQVCRDSSPLLQITRQQFLHKTDRSNETTSQ